MWPAEGRAWAPARAQRTNVERALRGWRILGGDQGVPRGTAADSSPSTFLNMKFSNKNSAVINSNRPRPEVTGPEFGQRDLEL